MLAKTDCVKGSDNIAIASSYAKTNSKVGKLIRDIQDNVTQKSIVLLLLEIAERPEICLDFDVDLPSYLDMFIHCQEDVVLSEASHLILSAAKIYSRRVDYVHECIQQIIFGMDRSIKVAEDSRKKTSPIKSKRALKRPRTEQDSLYEAEIVPKKIKMMPFAKTTEGLSSLNTFEAPNNFFRQWKKYKEWRAQYKRKLKCPVPYSTLHDNLVIHPSLWQLSCIEDFDYEDDIDTKRNYKVFIDYIEHRHSTLVNDINFNMHFKVKDFIEAEQDEIEIMNILGLPPPPKRKWPPICKSFRTEEKSSEVENEDYINNYLELENALIESENFDCSKKSQQISSQELVVKNHHAVRGKENIHSDKEARCNPDVGSSESVEMLISKKNQSEMCNDVNSFEDNNPKDSILSNDSISNCQLQATVEGTTNFQENNNNEKSENTTHEQNEGDLSKQKGNNVHIEKNLSDSFLGNTYISVNENLNTKNNQCANLNDCSLIISKSVTNSVSNLSILTNENEVNRTIEGTAIERTDSNSLKVTENQNPSRYGSFIDIPKSNNLSKEDGILDDSIIIRLSLDEGVALSDLDDIDRAMLSPVVELVDILKPIISKVPSPTDLVFHADQAHNFLEIDQALLTFRQDFTLPVDVILRKEEIKYNILEIPEHILRKTSLFKLPQDFNAFKKDRFKRKKELTNTNNKLKLHKLNDGRSNILTPPPSPPLSEEFFGFGDSSLVFDDMDAIIVENHEEHKNSEKEETVGVKASRSFSRDSGIGISAADNNPHNATSESLCSRNEIDRFFNTLNLDNSQNQNNGFMENPIFHSTVINNDMFSSSLNNDSECTTNTSRNCPLDLSSLKIDGRAPLVTLPESIEETPLDSNDETDSTSHLCNKENQNTDNLNTMIEKVQKWHRYLKPILHQSKERHHFDVFAIGTEIIDKFSETEEKESITFQDVVRDKEPSYISRYFLSSLLLANQNNIALQVLDTNKEEPVALNKIQLTLQSKKRHSVSMEDDIGGKLSEKRISVTKNQTESPTAQDNLAGAASEPSMKELLFFKRNEEKIFEILRKYRETNREMLIKEIEENRDDYIRILSQKHDIDLGLYFSENEIQRLKTDNIRRNFQSECLIYPKNINIRQNKTSNIDDTDSGFHSQNTTKPESVIL